MSVRCFSLVLTCLLISVGSLSSAQDASKDRLSRIFADWEQRRQVGPVQYQIEGERTWLQGSVDVGENKFVPEDEPKPVANRPPRDVVGPVKRTFLLDLRRNRFRLDFDDRNFDRRTLTTYRIHCLDTGDGTLGFVRVLADESSQGNRARAKPHVDMEVFGGDPHIVPPRILLNETYLPIFYAAGVANWGEADIRPTLLAPPIDKAAYQWIATTQYEGQECDVLQSKNNEILVDQGRDSAVVRVTVNPDRQYMLTINYQKTELGWLPSDWSETRDLYGKPTYRERMKVVAIETHPNTLADLFTLRPEPEMYVENTSYYIDKADSQLKEDSTYYRVAAGGDRIPLREDLFPIEVPAGPRSSKSWVFSTGLAFLAMILLFWLARKIFLARRSS